MYHIELLPSSSAHLTPGWTYVPDRGFNPAQAALTPAVGRKRGIRDPGGRGDLSSRENNAILRHLGELDRENHRDVQIAIPVKQKDAAGRGTRGKVTSNVRRILQSQKVFRNHLEDEEAFLSQTAQQTTTGGGPAGGAGATTTTTTAQAQRLAINRITKPAQRRSSTPVTTQKTESAMRQRKRTPAAPSSTAAETPETPAAATDTAGPAEGAPPTPLPTDSQHLISSECDNDPLLRSRMPSVPSDRIMQALLSEPPLPYNASRAGPPLTGKSPRFFCVICGYWGKIRCRGCHVRTCGLGCYKVHEESRCGAFL